MTERGLTLVELLISLVVFMLVAGALVTALLGYLSVDRAFSDRASALTGVRAAYGLLSRELRHACAISGGNQQSIAFRYPRGGVSSTVSYQLVAGNLDRCQAGDPSGWVRVVPHVVRFQLAYFDASGNLISTPISEQNDETVRRIDITLAVTSQGQGDTTALAGSVVPQNLRS